MTRLELPEEPPTANSTSFWTVWMALARVSGVDLASREQVRIDDIIGIKERLFHVYESFAASPQGLQRWALRDALYPLDLSGLFSGPPQGVKPTRGQLDAVVSALIRFGRPLANMRCLSGCQAGPHLSEGRCSTE